LSLLREPLAHFLLAAAIIVAVDAWLVVPEERTVRVPAEALARGIAEREAVLGRAASAAERAEVADALADGEILRREAVARGLDRGPQFRSLLAQRMRELLTSEPPFPDESDLRSWYETHPERFESPALFDFDQVLFRRPADVPPDLLARLESGADFWTLGDPIPSGSSVRDATNRSLANEYGRGFVEHLRSAPLNAWWRVESPDEGARFVRVRRRTPAVLIPFEESGTRVSDDWRQARAEESLERELVSVRERYRIIVEWPE